jgi:hypothetical protein
MRAHGELAAERMAAQGLGALGLEGQQHSDYRLGMFVRKVACGPLDRDMC